MTAGLAIGFQLWPQACTWDERMAAARATDDAGFDSIWSNDHFLPMAFDPEGLIEDLVGPYFPAPFDRPTLEVLAGPVREALAGG